LSELQSSLPLIDLPSGAHIIFEAIDATSGAAVAGVTVANVAISYEAGTAASAAPELPPALAFAPGVD